MSFVWQGITGKVILFSGFFFPDVHLSLPLPLSAAVGFLLSAQDEAAEPGEASCPTARPTPAEEEEAAALCLKAMAAFPSNRQGDDGERFPEPSPDGELCNIKYRVKPGRHKKVTEHGQVAMQMLFSQTTKHCVWAAKKKKKKNLWKSQLATYQL